MRKEGRNNNNKGNSDLALRLIFDASLAVGMLAFAASLWGIPGLQQLGIAIGVGLVSALVTFAILYLCLALYNRSPLQEIDSTEDPAYEAKHIPGKAYGENESLDQFTLSVNSITENEHTVASGYSPKPTPAFPQEWSVKLIETLEWQVFDRLCIAYWQIKGNAVVDSSKGSLAGVNFFICAGKNKNARLGVVQSRSAQSSPASVVEMQNLLKLKSQHKLPLAVLMHGSRLSNVVSSFCEGQGIRLIDAENIYKGLSALPEATQKGLLQRLIRPDYMIPTCPACRIKLVKRKRKDTGRIFWGCISYPECRFNMDYAAHHH